MEFSEVRIHSASHAVVIPFPLQPGQPILIL